MSLSGNVQAYIEKLEQENKSLKSTIANNVISFEEKVKKLENEKRIVEDRNKILEEKLQAALYRHFNRHAERFAGIGQPLLFESEEKAAPVIELPDDKVIVKEHERRKKGRKPIADNIPREDIIIDIPDDEKHCACGHDLVCIGEDVNERLCMIPQQLFVKRFHIRKYACPCCEGSGDEDKPAVRTGKVPANIMPGSIATPELLSYIFTQKYSMYMPFYRQEAAFRMLGIELSRQNMSHWQINVCKKLQPLLQELKAHIKTGNVVNMDETVMIVFDEPKRKNKQQSRMWLSRGGPPGKKALWYEYDETRSYKNIVEMLDGYSGYLQADGYEAYYTALNSLPGVKLAGCFAHARRKFYEAQKISNTPHGDAEAALSQIRGLYTVEKDLREKLKKKTDKEIQTPEKFITKRKERCEPILRAFHEWLLERENTFPDKSLLGIAVHYALNHWTELARYLEDAELTPDNNAAERAIRPFVMGRKNWVFSGSPAGAKSSCEILSLIESAKENGLNPYEYLRTVFTLAADMTEKDDWSRLLPWNMKI